MPPAPDQKQLRRALGQFPTGVTVVTTIDANGDDIGVTASSFNSVSMDPPLILWSIAADAFSTPAFENNDYFVVNVLGKNQTELSNRFASRGTNKFDGLDCARGVGRCAVIRDAAATFQCRKRHSYDGGDHRILVGEVLDLEYSETTMPLVFSRGSYSVATPQPSAGKTGGVGLSKAGDLNNFLLYQLTLAQSLYSGELYPLLMDECGVTPEEWRVLTILAETGSIPLESLAAKVMQPEQECRSCLERLVDRDYVRLGDAVDLRPEGRNAAERLLAVARTHEQTVLASLSKNDRTSLSQSLAKIVESFSGTHGSARRAAAGP